ncbi:hypothetical protein ACO2Q8_24985 [Larkinella sp. VNQ87]|uniref:hypothetical protein n=1 Tax=Larkinella sp. VNQ87 TaxID=3400921 RepID=UPI003C033AFD
MTLDEFRSLELDSTSDYVVIHLTGDSYPLQPVQLLAPLPTEDQPVLHIAHLSGKRRWSVIPYEFSGPISYHFRQLKLEAIDSMEVLPFYARNRFK